LTFDLLTSGSVHAEVLPWTLVLIALAVFLLERGQTDEQTDRRDWAPYTPPAAKQLAWVIIMYYVGNYVLLARLHIV